jgi:hypothetical protein
MELSSVFELSLNVIGFLKKVLNLKLKGLEIGRTALKPSPKKPQNHFFNVKT